MHSMMIKHYLWLFKFNIKPLKYNPEELKWKILQGPINVAYLHCQLQYYCKGADDHWPPELPAPAPLHWAAGDTREFINCMTSWTLPHKFDCDMVANTTHFVKGKLKYEMIWYKWNLILMCYI